MTTKTDVNASELTEIDKSRDIIKRCEAFLEDSSRFNSDEITRQERTLASIEDVFGDEVVKNFKRRKRFNLSYSKIPVLVDAVSAPYCESPYHTNIDNEEFKDKQEFVDNFENALDTKLVSRKAFKRGATCGCGYLVVGINENDQPEVEFVDNQSTIAIDPNASKPSLADADEGATIQFISKRKAEKQFPEADLDEGAGIHWGNLSRWGSVENEVQMVCYYWKDEKGSVHQSTIVGNYVKDIDLRITTIPIIRFVGYEKYKRGHKPDHIGIADRLKDLQLAEAIAFSGMVERSNRTMKSKVAMSDKAMQGDLVLNGIRKCEDDESMVLPYHLEGGAPMLLTEKFETGDLDSIIERSRVLEQDTAGVLLQGIQPTEKTATETKFQQINQINNNDELYLNAEIAQRHLSSVILEIICGCIPNFTLLGGVGLYQQETENGKLIADVQALLQTNQPQLAYLACDNSKAKNADNIKASIKAQFPDVVFPTDNLDVWQELAKAKQIGNQAIQEAVNAVQQKQELEQSNNELNLQLLNSKQQLAQQAHEFDVNTQIRLLELQQKSDIENSKLAQKAEEIANKAVVEAEKVDAEKRKIVAEAMKQESPSSVTINNTSLGGADNGVYPVQ